MKLILMFMLSLTSIVGFSEDSSDGCGIASEVVGDKTMVALTSRATTRGSYSYVLDFTGTTFGKFGCAKHSIVKNNKMDIFFLESNAEVIAVEASQGRGEHLEGLARSLGCDDSMNLELGQILKKNYAEIFVKEQSESERLESIKAKVRESNQLKQNCSAV